MTVDREGWKLSWPIGTRPARYAIDAQPSILWAEVVRQIRATTFSLAAADAGVLAGDPGCGAIGGTAPAPLPGDFDGDGSVDAADYVVWRKRDGTQEGYDQWRVNFGRQQP